MVSHAVWKTWPSGLSNDKNLGLRPRFLSTESLGPCFSHGMGDHDQILHSLAMHYLHWWRVYANSLQWRHNEPDRVSNHQPHDCLLNRLFRRRSKITSKLRVTGLCAGNSPMTGEFPAQRACYAGNNSIWWRHRVDFKEKTSLKCFSN